MMAYLQKADWKRTKKTLETLGAPTNADELGVEREDVIEALEVSPTIRSERYTILNKLNLNRKDYERLARVTSVIE